MTGGDLEIRRGDPDSGAAGLLHPGGVRAAYRAYRQRQAMRLLALVPSGAVRPLYARAREWARERDLHRGEDPLATLRAYCEELLLLPPYREWLADASANPDAYVEDLERPATADTADREEPPVVTVEVRSVRYRGATWYASLDVTPTDDAWRGFISFRRDTDSPGYRTADVFREATAEDVRGRFRGFDDASLRAFLRSVLP